MSSLVEKLKEGLQDAVVFLRTLEQFRIPPVVERRRKELLEKLVHLQGDTLREEPPRFEPIDEEEEKAKDLKRSDSKVGGRVKEFEEVDTASKPKDAKSQKPQEQTAKGDKEVSGKKAKEKAEEGSSTLTSVEKAASEGGNGLSPEQTLTGGSCENLNKVDEKEKKKGLGFRIRRRGKDKEKSEKRAVSPARPESQIDDETQKEEPSTKQEEEKEDSVEDEDVKLQLQLERRVAKRFGGHQWQKVNVTLKEFTLLIGNKDKVDLVGCTVVTTDAGFDLFSHPERKSFMFRTENSDAKDKCLSTLQAAIDECTPAPSEPQEQQPEEEGKQDEVPKITVQITVEEEPATDSTEEKQPGESESQAKKKRESRVTPAPKIRKLPEQGVQMKGYMYRKTWRGWEKCWCVLTYNALYFTGMEESGEYSNMLPINQEEGGGSIKEKKGRDMQSKGLIIKPSKKSKSETVSIESSEFTQWYRQLEQVIGISGVELLSEDEGEGGLIDEELYEEVDQPPAVPASPRPPHVPLTSTIPVSDNFQDMGGEEIYEEFDDPLDAIPEAVSPQEQAPTLPQRNLTKNEPAPALPARNAPSTKTGSPARSPAFPTRNTPAKSKVVSDVQDYEVASIPVRAKAGIPARPPPPPTAPTAPIADEDDTYDDIVGVMGQEEIEETYDDVVTPTATERKPERSSLMSEENYEDMAPVEEGPTEDYVIMEPGEEGEEGDLYLEVDDTKPPAHALAQRFSLEQQKSSSPKTGTLSKIFSSVKTKSPATAAAETITKSQLSYKAPKKSKFSDEWCAVEGTSLQFFKSSTDKKPRDKIAINECDLKIGSTEAGIGEFAFRLAKGDKVHHFSVKTKEELDGWVTSLKVIAKSAAIELGDSVFQAKEDHIGEGEDQLTFKKGTYIRLITQTSGDMWIGQIGTDPQVFNGKIGKYPTSKVAVVEDMYV